MIFRSYIKITVDFILKEFLVQPLQLFKHSNFTEVSRCLRHLTKPVYIRAGHEIAGHES